MVVLPDHKDNQMIPHLAPFVLAVEIDYEVIEYELDQLNSSVNLKVDHHDPKLPINLF